MAQIRINISREDVYEEVGKATDYTGSKLIWEDSKARDKYYAQEADLVTLGRFWEEAGESFNERMRNMLIGYTLGASGDYSATIEVSLSYDMALTPSVEKTTRSFFISYIIGSWFKLAKKNESEEYFAEAEEALMNVERLLYTRRRPRVPAG